ncbi:hypothetical protein pA_gene0042 [Vibrio phage 13VT501A]|nr:hypothetical protein pA_gene0042 [Vibrio phage 13VT501A]
MSDNLTGCPHCWSLIKTTDTTCCQCGEAVDPVVEDAQEYEPQPKLHQRKLCDIVFYVAVLVGAVVITMIGKGEL